MQSVSVTVISLGHLQWFGDWGLHQKTREGRRSLTNSLSRQKKGVIFNELSRIFGEHE